MRDATTYNAAIAACEKDGQAAEALELLQEMKDAKIERNTITYNAAIGACEKGGKAEEALELLQEMKDTKVDLDTITYNAAICACEKGGMAAEALELLQEMKDAKVDCNTTTFNAVISACETLQPKNQRSILASSSNYCFLRDGVVHGGGETEPPPNSSNWFLGGQGIQRLLVGPWRP